MQTLENVAPLPCAPVGLDSKRRVSGNFVTYATLAEGAGKFFRVQFVWKAQVNATGVIQNFDLRRRKGQVEAGEIVLQLTALEGAENWYDMQGPVRVRCAY